MFAYIARALLSACNVFAPMPMLTKNAAMDSGSRAADNLDRLVKPTRAINKVPSAHQTRARMTFNAAAVRVSPILFRRSVAPCASCPAIVQPQRQSELIKEVCDEIKLN